jgi:hypothetical protein
MYELRGVIAAEEVLAPVADVFDVRPVALRGGRLWLLPLTDDRYRTVTGTRNTFLCTDDDLPAMFTELLVTCSMAGPIAFVEADFFGGEGAQAARVWWEGELAMGPLFMSPGEEYDPTPISQALLTLGVGGGGRFDAFELVGLGWHRETEDWVRLGGPLSQR